MDWQAVKERLALWREERVDSTGGSKLVKIGFVMVPVYLLLAVGVGVYWSMTPAQFPVQENAIVMAELYHHCSLDPSHIDVAGQARWFHEQRCYAARLVAG